MKNVNIPPKKTVARAGSVGALVLLSTLLTHPLVIKVAAEASGAWSVVLTTR
jgi:hypothetical protein